MNFYKKETLPMQAMTYRHRMLAVNASHLIEQGDEDTETFDIAVRYIKIALQEIDDYKKAKALLAENESQTEHETSCNEGDATDTDAEQCGNKFGAAGSSAELSHTELLSMRPTAIKRKAGRPRTNRYKTRLDVAKKKFKKKLKSDVGRKRKGNTRCTTCDLYGNEASECMNIAV